MASMKNLQLKLEARAELSPEEKAFLKLCRAPLTQNKKEGGKCPNTSPHPKK